MIDKFLRSISVVVVLALAWMHPCAVAQEGEGGVPQIVSTVPEVGNGAVHPDTTELRVTFDRDMGGGFSWTGGGDAYPEVAAKPSWIDRRTCVLPVKLQPGKYYRVGINAPSHRNFKSAEGFSVTPTAFWFVTADADGRPVEALQPPKVVEVTPANGSRDVPPGTTELVVAFDRDMKDESSSWMGGDGTFPEVTERPYRRDDGVTYVLPVKLEPGQEYIVWLNDEWNINFQSTAGVPVVPTRYTFATAEE
jgi:hypothetical protein